jgi:hypothetical protein
MRGRDAAVSAVSELEKKADRTRRTAMPLIVARVAISIGGEGPLRSVAGLWFDLQVFDRQVFDRQVFGRRVFGSRV